MKGLDNHIMGVNLYREEEVKHLCTLCGNIKMVRMFFDMGGWFYFDDPYCCATPMHILEE